MNGDQIDSIFTEGLICNRKYTLITIHYRGCIVAECHCDGYRLGCTDSVVLHSSCNM